MLVCGQKSGNFAMRPNFASIWPPIAAIRTLRWSISRHSLIPIPCTFDTPRKTSWKLAKLCLATFRAQAAPDRGLMAFDKGDYALTECFLSVGGAFNA